MNVQDKAEHSIHTAQSKNLHCLVFDLLLYPETGWTEIKGM